ncbi:MAG TPA: GNAT family N-acetyltransferase [Roseiflexaceae bacterium]|nr:GNAT family N-acetyltransferase [Roseiflexaceae bacterium]HMP40402.1 GNAT family N-acetyltransferase [Roseiflexaceae bacterium]
MSDTMRIYSGEHDYAAMRRLLIGIAAATGTTPYCTIGDLDWWRSSVGVEQLSQTPLWFDSSGILVAFAWPAGNQVDIVCRADRSDLVPGILAWAEQHRRSNCPPAEQPAVLRAWSLRSDTQRLALFAQCGYQPIDECLAMRERTLEDLPLPVVPPGYRIRSFAGVAEVEARVEVHRAAFAPSRMTVARHLAVMQAPTYTPDLDLVVEAPDGSLAACCIIWHDVANRFGVFEPVGCHPDHRRRGITRAMLFDGLRRLRDRGCTRAMVANHANDPASANLYQSAGFTIHDHVCAWERAV